MYDYVLIIYEFINSVFVIIVCQGGRWL